MDLRDRQKTLAAVLTGLQVPCKHHTMPLCFGAPLIIGVLPGALRGDGENGEVRLAALPVPTDVRRTVLGIDDRNAGQSRDAMDFCETNSRRRGDRRRHDLQIASFQAIAEQHQRVSFTAEPWTPQQAVETGNMRVQELSPGAGVRVFGSRRVDQFIFRDRGIATRDRQLAKPGIDEFEQHEIPRRFEFGVTRIAQAAPRIGGRRNMRNVMKDALERGRRQSVGGIKGWDVGTRSARKRIETRPIFGHVDAFAGIGIERVRG
jgi:hypothetical protein